MPGILGSLRKAPLLTLAILLVVLKSVQFAIDSTALFFFDSGAFVLNALRATFISERSYVYGFLLRIFAVPFHSLHAIVALQIAMGVITAWLLGLVLIRFLKVRPWIAILAALAFAFDPVQIVHEHLIMTETTTLLVMAVFLLAASQYLQAPRLWWLVSLAFLGILLVSLRMVYLPLAFLSAAVLPVAAYLWAPPQARFSGRRRLTVALLVSCGSTLFFHLGYARLTGRLASSEPAYHFGTGFFLVGGVAPLIEARDTNDPRVARAVLDQNKSVFPLYKPEFRPAQMWEPEGLVARLRATFGGDARPADEAARSLAMAAIVRHPVGFLELGVVTYLNYWRGLPRLRWSVAIENGSGPKRQVTPFDVDAVRSAFGVDVSNQYLLHTPSRSLHIWGRYWYLFLLASPFFAALALWLSRGEERVVFRTLALFFLWSSCLLVSTCMGASEASYRYLHPFSFIGLVAIAFIAEWLRRHWSAAWRTKELTQ